MGTSLSLVLCVAGPAGDLVLPFGRQQGCRQETVPGQESEVLGSSPDPVSGSFSEPQVVICRSVTVQAHVS